jgi:WD40 repeat protein/DNA-binding CsgD family transcriptional regulator
MQDPAGTILKGYELLERIGAGGFGAVYRARQSTIDREVAVKVILPGLANEPDFIRRFETEARLIARLEHPHITPLYDFWRDPDGAYLVMRYLRGGSLRSAINEEGAYDLVSTARLLDQLAAALDLAHRQDVIHRDIKPGNILLDEDDNAYLADFGIARDLINVKGGLTNPDGVVGSLDYISPEQARSEPVTPRTDIYSLGVTLYEMITGEHPFKEASQVERLYKHINAPLPLITGLPDDVRDTINEIIQYATAKDPDKRYPDVLALAVAFREAVGRGDTSRELNIVEQLTWREQEILQLIAEGHSNKEIADKLFVTLATVRWHIRQAYRKLGVRSRVQAMIRARELELLVSGQTSQDWPEAAPAMISLPEPDNPYKGLRAFEVADSRDFFGREDFTDKLIRRMDASERFNRFLAIVGPSGSGKSSLVKAGLIPALWRGDLPGSEKWFVVELLPGARPLDQLEVALVQVAANHANGLREQITRDKNGLLRVADIILPRDDTELVLVVDQFEEVFTLVEDEQERAQFLNLLRAAVTDRRSRVRVIITLRADYYDRPLHYPEFGELIRSRMETVLPLSAKGIERAIAGPAERVGVTFEPGLVAQIVSEMNYQAGALPLLQYALTELFDRRQGRLLTHEAYQEIGGAVGALAHRADEIYASLTSGGQEIVRQLFLRLVTLGEGAEDTRRRANRSELLSLAADADAMEEIIDAFADHRLLSLDHDERTRQPTVEVAHEAILREWERLRGWLNDSRADVRLQRQLAGSAVEWKHHEKDASYLLRGSRLQQVEQWSQITELALTPLEREFIAESTTQREARQQAEAERQAREAAQERRSWLLLRALVAVFALAAVVASGLTAFAFSQQAEAEAARAEAERSADEFRSIALTFGAQQALDDGQPDVALALALEAVSMDNPPRQAELTFLNVAASTWIKQRYVGGHDSIVYDVAYHPDGEHMVTTGWDGRINIWDIITGEVFQSIQHETFREMAINTSGTLVAAVGAGDTVLLWNLETGETVELVTGDDAQQRAPAFNRDGTLLLTSGGGIVHVWDVETYQLLHSFEIYDGGRILRNNFSPDESLVVTCATLGQVKIWEFATGQLVQTLEHPADEQGQVPWIFTCQFLPDSNRVITGSAAAESWIYLWDWRAGEILWQVEVPGHVQDIALSPDGRWFVAGMNNYMANPAEVHLRDLKTGSLLRVYNGHTQRVRNVAYSSDGTAFLTASDDRTVTLWPVMWEGSLRTLFVPGITSSGPEASTLAVHPQQPLAAVVALVDSAGRFDPKISIVNYVTGEVVHMLDGHNVSIGSLTFSPDGRLLIVGGQNTVVEWFDQTAYIWEIETGELFYTFDGLEGWLRDATFHPEGGIIAVADAAAIRLVLWDGAASEVLRVLDGRVHAVVFSPDGEMLYSDSEDGSLLQWDVHSGEMIRRFEGQPGSVLDLDISADGQRLASASREGIGLIWDTTTGRVLHHLEGHTGIVYSVQFSPDNRHIVTSSADGTAILWDVATGSVLRRYRHDGGANAIYVPDGQLILTAGSDKLIVWDASPWEEGVLAWVKNNRYIPDFTCEQRELYHIEPLCETNP